MDVTLLNKNIPVVTINMEINSGYISDIISVHNREYLPIHLIQVPREKLSEKLTYWWRMRAIPASRDGLAKSLDILKMSSVSEMLARSSGLSLSDQYWIRPANSPHKWEQVNYFHNK